jgi:hypothetical protein
MGGTLGLSGPPGQLARLGPIGDEHGQKARGEAGKGQQKEHHRIIPVVALDLSGGGPGAAGRR